MNRQDERSELDESPALYRDVVQLARVALDSGSTEVHVAVRRLARRYRHTRPELSTNLIGLLRESPLRSASDGTPLNQPVDSDSRLALVREEYPVLTNAKPILSHEVRQKLDQLREEHQKLSDLLKAGLSPTRTGLFTGPPGVGKTLAARWLAQSLDVPLIVLDLSSVMSSFLGRTGANVKRVLEYAKTRRCILLLDELDAVAKRRDDATEIGELKRLVTVLLQEIDNWPEGSLLLAATNHAELLDPAVWRRFEVLVEFPLPDQNSVRAAVIQYLDGEDLSPQLLSAVGHIYSGASFSEIEREVMRARRLTALQNIDIQESFFIVARDRIRAIPTSERGRFAAAIVRDTGLSQRRTQELTGVSRDTLRKYLNMQ